MDSSLQKELCGLGSGFPGRWGHGPFTLKYH